MCVYRSVLCHMPEEIISFARSDCAAEALELYISQSPMVLPSGTRGLNQLSVITIIEITTWSLRHSEKKIYFSISRINTRKLKYIFA